ncbi:TNF receptor-associated factor 2-like [Xenia sp. Carnegie-2017]|uniref:TNF receptor-associated factor 2-like n=1 Tax=Xenia sp. Carnegie-2017 TaxID=2897299 RepID=UPI001F04E48E|nr:TNF receptor-associated factor 2-like [Xenia sp. Carnegie-2017]
MQAFPENFAERELKNIRLHCLSEECKWFGAYEELEGHSQVCEHALISCVHKQCNIQLPLSLLDEHLNNDCEYRNVKCEYCGKDVPYASLKKHEEIMCENYGVVCKYCMQMIPRKDIEHHESTTCDEVPTKCEFQAISCNHDKTLKRQEIRQHMNDTPINHVSLLLRYVMAFVIQLGNFVLRPEFTTPLRRLVDQVTAFRAYYFEKFVMLDGKITGLERRIECLEGSGGSNSYNTQLSSEVSLLRERIATLERQAKDDSSTIQRFRERLDQVDESIHNVKSALGSNQAIQSYNGTLLWKIDNFNRKRQDAINGVKNAWYSPPFYSSQYGYKMCANICMNGDSRGNGTHLSLFFVIMKGDYDALQTWPFQK